ncbi:MAG: hypothetical protein U0X58_12760 [Flavobacteriaceae bacterium]
MNSKIFFKYTPLFLLLGFVAISVSCSEDDVYTGAPTSFKTINATISTPETEVVGGQPFEITINLGDNPNTPDTDLLTFTEEVNVEVTAFVPSINRRLRKTITIPANQNVFVTSMTAPSGDVSPSALFNKDMEMYLSAITTTPDAEVVGFKGVNYKVSSNKVILNYGETTVLAENSKRLSVVFDFQGPYGTHPLANNLDLIISKNGTPLGTLLTNNNLTYKPFYGTQTATITGGSSGDYFALVDVNQRGYISHLNLADISAGKYIYKPLAGTTVANSVAHGLEVGDEVSLSNFNNGGSSEIIVQVESVPDPYSFTFTYGGPSILGSESAFSQVTSNPEDIVISNTQNDNWWDPYVAYKAGDLVQVNNAKYYCIKDVAANIAGNEPPPLSSAFWTATKPFTDWPVIMQGTVATWNNQAEYKYGDVVMYNGFYFLMNGYVAARTVGTNPLPTANGSKWVRAMKEYKIEALNYNSSDTYTISVYAQKLGGVTNNAPATDIEYKFGLRYPNNLGKTYKGTLTGITTGAANAVPKLQIVRTTTQGVSTYSVTQLP